jgi:phage-related protein
MTPDDVKPVEWVGSSYDDFTAFPKQVQQEMGHALYLAQCGEMHVSAKPLRGFGGAGVVELVEADRHGSYRAVYTVKFWNAVYVLHAFQKKSKKGIATPREEIELVKHRLKVAEENHKALTKGWT